MIGGDSFLQSEQEVNYFLQVDWLTARKALKLLDFSNFGLIL